MKHIYRKWIFAIFCGSLSVLQAQTDLDGIMMSKNNLCAGLMFSNSSWTHYWEGTYYRSNENLGTVTTRAVTAMANYGLSDKLNLIFTLPYVATYASAGTLSGMRGIQDLSLMAKYKWVTKKWKSLDYSLIGVGGVSAPISGYVADYLPLSIGFGSKNVMGRLLLDVAKNQWFFNASGTYMVRSNVTIDREAYYTTRMVYSNKVIMPDVRMLNLRAGYRVGEFVAELFYDVLSTVGGFDIRKNDMPFLSNNMDGTRLGMNLKVPIPKTNGLSIAVQSAYTLKGRNIGKSWMNAVGVFYLANFTSKKGSKS